MAQNDHPEDDDVGVPVDPIPEADNRLADLTPAERDALDLARGALSDDSPIIVQTRDEFLADEPDDDDRVGYKKPPKKHRIKEGEVRNPNGRRGKKKPSEKLALPPALAIGKMLLEPIPVNVSGKTIKLPKQEIMMRSLIADYPSMNVADKLRVLKYFETGGHIGAYEQFEAHLEHMQQLDEAEERRQMEVIQRTLDYVNAAIEASPRYTAEDLSDWLMRVDPERLDQFREELVAQERRERQN